MGEHLKSKSLTEAFSVIPNHARTVQTTKRSPVLFQKDNNIIESEEEKLQRELDLVMMVQPPTLFGIERKEMTDEELQIPLFTGSLILLASLALTFYGFYVFFTGSDPARDVTLY
jgi:hypothetical protein